MQSILNIKLKMETQAKQEFGSARAALDEEEERLHNLQGRKTEYEKEAKRLLSGTLNVRAIEDNKAAILCMDEYISAQQQNVREAERKLEEARKRLADVMMERKTHETLKERLFNSSWRMRRSRKVKKWMSLPAILTDSGRKMTGAAL